MNENHEYVSDNKIIPMLFVLATALIQSVATAIIKYAMLLFKVNPSEKWLPILLIIAAIAMYVLNVFPYFAAISRLKLSVFQPVMTSSMFILTILISH